MKYLGASSIYICLKILEQVNEINTREMVDKLKILLNLEE